LAEAGINKMYQVYGEGQPVSKILKAMLADRKRGGNPELRIEEVIFIPWC
jgi:hypothetical protein